MGVIRRNLVSLGFLVVAGWAPAAPAEPASSDSQATAWEEALRLEREGALLAAAEHFAEAAERGEHPQAHWRAARSYWQVADALPSDRDAARVEYLVRADTWAGRGLEANPACGECALWKYAAMGRLTEHRGMLWGARNAREMQSLLDRGIALRPQHRDPNGNAALANLYYASAVFHRLVPEWFWLPLVTGVKGDTDRALADIREALAISSDRIDYRVEHGAVLLCQGRRRDRSERIDEGLRALANALTLTPTLTTDRLDQELARQLIAEPEKACGFSRRGFIDIEGEGRRVAVSAGR